MLFEQDPRSTAVDELHYATAIYTSLDVVDGMLDQIDWPVRGGKLFDPSAGDGAFLMQALRRLTIQPDDMSIVDRLLGWEIHPGAVKDARNRIVGYLVEIGWSLRTAKSVADQIVVEADFLTDTLPAREFTCIAGNPPYLRMGNLPQYFKAVYSKTVPKYAFGDLLHAFLDRCTRILSDDGIISLVTADRWLLNSTSADLRETIGRLVDLDHVSRLDPSTSFSRPKFRRAASPPRVHPVKIVLRRKGHGARPLTAGVISPDEFGVELDCSTITLAHIATVRIAPWLGPNGCFIVDQEVAAGLPTDQLVPVVDTDDIDRAADTITQPKRFAIVTTPEAEPTGAIREHLLANLHRLPPRARKGKRYWMPPEAISLPLDRPSLMIPRIARQLRPIFLPAGVLPHNHNLSVVSALPGMSNDELKTLLLSDHCQAWIQRNAPRLENGFFSITTKLLQRMPMPAGFAVPGLPNDANTAIAA